MISEKTSHRKIATGAYINYNCAMATLERERRSPYEAFQKGDKLIDVPLKTLNPDGTVAETAVSGKIEEVKSGGFHGKVLVIEGQPIVIKTGLPDALHHLPRTIYWDFREFPAQTSEVDAKLEHLSARIIHKVLPTLTDGKYYAPNSLGYIKLSTGYAQVLEKIKGRPPRFDTGEDEYARFREAQKELSELAFRLGLEHVGQIHPDNPFGMANVWFDPKYQTFVWLDTLPAIPHRGPFKFHRDIRNKFAEKKPTFNRIHTDRFLDTLRKNRYLFPYDVYKDIEDDVLLYEKLWQERKPTRLNIEDFFDASDELLDDALRQLPQLLKKGASTVASPVRILLDSKYRHKIIMSGVEEAKRQGLITENEFCEALKAVEGVERDPRRRNVMFGLLAYYFAVGRASDIIWTSILASSAISNDLVSGILKAFAFDTFFPPLARRIGTLAIGKANKIDLKAAATVASIPFVPLLSYIAAPPVQTAASSASRSELIWHYKVRELIASLSKIHPAGGYGTQPEAWLWKKIGSKLERLGKNSKSD